MIFNFDISFVLFTFLLLTSFSQHKTQVEVDIETREDDGCLYVKCGVNEFCCDGECCLNLSRNWFTWFVLVGIIFVIILLCLFMPCFRKMEDNIKSTQYYFISPEKYQHYDTMPYKQQPSISQNSTSISERRQPYTYERYIQQTSRNEWNQPTPSAPPKSP
ncbi:uncharacterized protein LOC124440599 [Xenia sp. Carnegie-2017]|uniref:uncharacterized protein LOC124440599 n=1 Tax=Xenia sp. Carnegie-2017 TaxID=2897299 RepID=UPI001F04DAFC|nr:uncharacterized protein LOC124440599 [Xenia sp. Carnegie-2017]